MKFYKYIFLLFIIAFTGNSCEDELDLLPAQSISGDIAVTTESNIANILIGAYEESGQSHSYGGRLQMMADLLGSGSATSWSGTFIQPRQVKNKTILPDNSFVTGYWNNAYEVINQTNLVLDNIAIVTSSAAERDRIEGEARFLRALTYFDLNRHFGTSAGGVPLRTTGILDYSTDLAIARASLIDIDDLVVNDLKAAMMLLPDSNEFFADKYSAEALLARVYLYLKNREGARDAAHNVIMNSGHSLSSNYAGAFNNDNDGSEDVFAFQVTSQTGTNQLNTFYADEGNGGRGGDITVTDDYVALFDDPNDERANFFYNSAQSGERLTSKYMNEFGNIPLIRLAEMYLIRAETNWLSGTMVGDTPINDVNAVRNRSSAAPLVAPIQPSDINAERILELSFEGFGVHDVVRLQGTVDGFLHTANELRMPIPQSEMDTNPMMVQNPGY